MEGGGNPYMDRYMKVLNDWNYVDSCVVASLLVWHLENFRHMIFVAQILQVSYII